MKEPIRDPKTGLILGDVPATGWCRAGHDLEVEGLKVMSNGKKICRTCYRIKKNASKRRAGGQSGQGGSGSNVKGGLKYYEGLNMLEDPNTGLQVELGGDR